MGRIYASADIGSNTVHLLIAEKEGGSIQRVRNESEWLSLGEVVSSLGRIPPEMQDRLVATLRSYVFASDQAKAERLYVFATEAMRVAENHERVLQKIKKEVGIKVDLISGRREAELGLRGALIDSQPTWPFLLVEVGGGSAQVALCEDRGITQEVSLPLGTGRLISDAGLTDPPSTEQIERMERLIDERLLSTSPFERIEDIVACGGVARGLIRALHRDGDPTLHIAEVDFLRWTASRLTEERLAARFGVKAKRAGTLLPGAAVYGAILRKLSRKEMRVSEFGVREGAILELAEKRI